MVKLTSMDGRVIVLNAYLIEKVESVPETVITLTSGKKYIVRETVDEVIHMVIQFHKSIFGRSVLAEEVKKVE